MNYTRLAAASYIGGRTLQGWALVLAILFVVVLWTDPQSQVIRDMATAVLTYSAISILVLELTAIRAAMGMERRGREDTGTESDADGGDGDVRHPDSDDVDVGTTIHGP